MTMAQPKKTGLEYFQADVDMFQDRKIKRLLRAAGGKGFTVFMKILAETYRDQGYYYEWDQHSAFDISDDLNFSENLVEETVDACCAIGLFHKDLYAEESILTSESIQNRWQSIVINAGRAITKIDADKKIIDGERIYQQEESEPDREERGPGNRSNPPGKRTLEGWEKFNDDIPLQDADIRHWVKDKDIDLTEADIDDEIEVLREKANAKDWRYKDWVAFFQNFLRNRYLKPNHWAYVGDNNGQTNENQRHNGNGSGHQYQRDPIAELES